MRLLWLTVNSSYSHSSLALPLIHSAAAQVPGWEWRHFSATVKDDPFQIASAALEYAPDLLCVPLYIFNRREALDAAARLKTLLPQCLIAAGGPESLNSAAKLLEDCPFLDFVLAGEGEAVFPQFLRLLGEGNPDFSTLPGLAYRSDGGICAVPGIPVFEEWEHAEPPCFDEFFDASKPFVQLETARGCPGKCIFCTSAGTPVRLKSLELVHRELTRLRELGIREIRVLDRTFNLPPTRAAELIRMFREDFPEIRFHLEIHPGFLGQELRSQLQLAVPGKLHLEAGIQTLEPVALTAIGRKDTRERVLEGLAFLRSIPGLAVHTDLIAGCPEQTWQGLLADLRLLLELGPDEIQMEIMKVLPGTKLAADARSLGILHATSAPYDVMGTPTMPPDDNKKARFLSRIIDLFYNAPSLAPSFRKAAEKDGFLENFMDFLQSRGMNTGNAPHLKQRFLWFSQYTASPEIRGLLAAGWLEEGFPWGEGPAVNARLVRELPPTAVFLRGSREAAALKTSKFIELPERSMYFVSNRAIAPNKAAAVFTN